MDSLAEKKVYVLKKKNLVLFKDHYKSALFTMKFHLLQHLCK